MNISEAKRIRIVDFLQSLGHVPVRIRHNQYWYLSPFREEQMPSFKVNDKLNEWYDFALSEGGGIIELVLRLYRLCSVSEALRVIESRTNALPSARLPLACAEPDIGEAMTNMVVLPLSHHALLSYLRSRYVDMGIARQFCKEIHYELRKRHYFPSPLKMCPAVTRCVILIIKVVSGRKTSPSSNIRRGKDRSMSACTKALWISSLT